MSPRWYALCLGLVFPSVLVGLDLVAPVFCASVPLAAYLVACAIGAAVAIARGRRPEHAPRLRGVVVAIIAACGVLGALSFELWPVASWDTKCAHRHCSRALGMSLSGSPFPVGAPSCRHLSMCANEAVLSDDEYEELVDLNRAGGCPEF